MKKIIKFFRLKRLERKLLWAYIASIIEEKATWVIVSRFPNIFHDKAEKIREEWYKVRYDKQNIIPAIKIGSQLIKRA